MQRSIAIIAVVLACGSAVVRAGDWPAFRGPASNGMSSEVNVPTSWSTSENIKWKVALPQPGNSSPIVSGNRVFLTCAQDSEGKQRALYCFDRADGKELWVRVVQFDKKMPTHKTNPYCSTTPVTDGKRVVVWHSSAGLYCYDFQGSELWSRDLGEFEHQWGYATSPILYGDRVILSSGPGEHTFMTAIDLATGKDIWRTDEPTEGDGRQREDGNVIGSWSTPLIKKVDGKDQIICSMPTRLVGYDPENGNILWTCDGLHGAKGSLVYSSPVVGEGVCLVIGGFSGPGFAMKLGGSGNLTESNRLWLKDRNPQSIGSGVIIGKHAYLAHAGPGSLSCTEVATGEETWKDRAGGSNHWGSVLLADGKLYVTNQKGTTHVFKPNPEAFELIASNELNEASNSTPAISDGQIFIRTFENLYCIEQ